MNGPLTPSRWLHRWAVFTVLLVFVQLLLGSVVTTFQVGMADPVWPTAPWALLFINWQEPASGYLIEHTHRLAGSVVGVAVIVLAVWVWLYEPRWILRVLGVLGLALMVVMLAVGFAVAEPWIWFACLGTCAAMVLAFLLVAIFGRDPGLWLRWAATTALAGVIVQGLFGGFRVFWHVRMGPELSIVHGVLAQVYFAFLACLTLRLAPQCGEAGWTTPPVGLRRASLLAVVVVFCQLLMGALLRHSLHPVWQRLHLIVAFLVVFAVAGLIWQVFRHRAGDARGKRLAVALAVLLGWQVLVGVEAWMGRFSAGRPPELVITTVGQAVVRTLHVLTGALVFALTAVTALWVRRPVVAPSVCEAVPARELEGVA